MMVRIVLCILFPVRESFARLAERLQKEAA